MDAAENLLGDAEVDRLLLAANQLDDLEEQTLKMIQDCGLYGA